MTRDIVFRKVPELNDITHAEMREKCADTLLEALRLGGWSSFEMLEETPYLENGKPGPGRIEFIREVAALAADEYDELIEWIDEMAPCDRDTILAAALLSDIGVYVTKGPRPPENADLYNKTEWAGYLAQKNGLPGKVVYILLTLDPVMAPEGSKAVLVNELRFVRSSYFTLLSALIS